LYKGGNQHFDIGHAVKFFDELHGRFGAIDVATDMKAIAAAINLNIKVFFHLLQMLVELPA
jgi:hypothetical protein